MRLIARRNLKAFGEKNPSARAGVFHWAAVVERAEWKTMSDVTNASSKAKSVGGDRVGFDVGQGNRLVAAFNFKAQICCVKFVGTHAEYDKIDAATVSMF
ncbi:MAG TPA: type II toxin-antitoxin system HigB family toxin [Phenylobacterium sp.]|jgi:mRNA interferase HigB